MLVVNKIRRFFESPWFAVILFACSALSVIYGKEVAGTIVLANIAGLVLIFCPSPLISMFPVMFLGMVSIRCYDSAGIFLPLWHYALFPVVAIVFNLIFYRKRFTLGKSAYGVLAVAVAITLGGIGSISPEEYFSPTALFYVVALGFGMFFAYLILNSRIAENEHFNIYEKFVDLMICVTLFAAFMVFYQYYVDFSVIIEERDLPQFQWSNNISTFLMIAMPYPLYRARKNPWVLLVFLLNYAAIILSSSRGGWVMGTVEFVICLLFSRKIAFRKKWLHALFCVGALAIAAFVAITVYKMTPYYSEGKDLILSDEARVKLLKRSIEDFRGAPIFGKGIGSRANYDLYSGKKGTMIWYHMMIPQIIGSMGCLGIAAYGYQLFGRVRLVFKNFTPYTCTLGLSYLGLFLMSQVNPGEFCPLPYGLLAVLTFIMIEKFNKIKA